MLAVYNYLLLVIIYCQAFSFISEHVLENELCQQILRNTLPSNENSQRWLMSLTRKLL
jgi:hypothetical protein